jgi:hypothetical protein
MWIDGRILEAEDPVQDLGTRTGPSDIQIQRREEFWLSTPEDVIDLGDEELTGHRKEEI